MDKFSTLASMIQYMINAYRNSYALNDRIDEQWKGMSTEAFVEKVRRLSLGLRKLGLKQGETVGILSRSSAHWLVADLAVIVAGGISVPFFSYISEKNFLYEVNNADVKWFIVVGGEQWAAVAPHHHLFKKVIMMDVDENLDGHALIDMHHVMSLGDELSRENPGLYAEMLASVQEDDLATIIFTSGSTGIPKGVELTHRNIISQVMASEIRFPLNPKVDRALSLLPLAHIFERMLVYYYLSQGVSIYFADDIKNLMTLCQETKPTVGAMVPLVIEKIYSRTQSVIESGGMLTRMVGKWALGLGHRSPKEWWRRILYRFADKFVYSQIRNSLGGSYRAIIVGGAALPKTLCDFFLNIGVPLYQGYGLTETSPVLCTNYPDHNKSGTVGKPFPSVQLRLTSEGEIIVKGPNVMRGYHHDSGGTQELFDADGWFHTGDKGSIDEHGFVTVTGRIKEIMKTSGGKMVAPLPIEQALCQAPFIDMAMVVANDRKFVTSLLFPNFEELSLMKRESKQENVSHEDFLEGRLIRQKTDELIESVNSQLNEWEKIRAYRYVVNPLSVAEGELTPTFKINRDIVASKYQELINSMY